MEQGQHDAGKPSRSLMQLVIARCGDRLYAWLEVRVGIDESEALEEFSWRERLTSGASGGQTCARVFPEIWHGVFIGLFLWK